MLTYLFQGPSGQQICITKHFFSNHSINVDFYSRELLLVLFSRQKSELQQVLIKLLLKHEIT